jgi:hypothetical protein
MTGVAQQHESQVRVGAWRSTYLVPRTHPSPERVRDRLDAAVNDDLPGKLATHLAQLLDGDGDELIFVRRLDLDFPVDASWDRSAIAMQCAQVLTWRLARELAAGDSANVIRFGSRAEYLARFIADRASGDAGSRWYYARFSGLHALPCSAALRTALLEDIELGLLALRALADHELVAVIAALGNTECTRVCDALAAGDDSGDDAWAFDALAAVARVAVVPGSITTASELALWWVARSTVAAGGGLLLAARAVASAAVAIGSGVIGAATLLRALNGGDAAAAASVAHIGTDALLRLRLCPPSLLAELFASRAPATGAGADIESFGSTPFGGPFVLLDDLFALPLDLAMSGWRGADGVGAAQILRFLVLSNCCGGARAAAVFSDPLWRRLFGVVPTIDRAAAANWLASLGPACRRRYARMIARFDARADGASERSAHDERGRNFRIVADNDGNWRALSFAAMASCIGLDRINGEEAEGGLDTDVDHLVADEESLPRAWSLLIGLTTQRVLRRFLRRLPGFSASHLAYAQRNLLEFSASVDAQAERIVVRLARPPLGLILNMTGCNRGARNWPLLDARPFALFNDG